MILTWGTWHKFIVITDNTEAAMTSVSQRISELQNKGTPTTIDARNPGLIDKPICGLTCSPNRRYQRSLLVGGSKSGGICERVS